MTRSIAEEITATLREEILRGQYRAGERLPSERDLATRFGANRGAVRESIKKLEQLGIIEVKPGGVRVVPLSDATLEVLSHLLDLEETPQPELVGQLLDVFGAMLSLSARSAVQKADQAQITALCELNKKLVTTMDDRENYYQCWRELGDHFTEINQNLVLKLIGNGLKTQFVGRMEKAGIHPLLDTNQDLQYLNMMGEGFKARNVQLVGNAIIGHFEMLKVAVINALQNKSNTDNSSTENRSVTYG